MAIKKFFNFYRCCVLFTLLMTTAALYVEYITPYKHQVDARKREYYPATVIDKKYYESCSKSRCSKNYILVIEREDGSVEDVPVNGDTYDAQYVGGVVRFERHITDPEVYFYRNTSLFFWLFSIFGWILVVFSRLVEGL